MDRVRTANAQLCYEAHPFIDCIMIGKDGKATMTIQYPQRPSPRLALCAVMVIVSNGVDFEKCRAPLRERKEQQGPPVTVAWNTRAQTLCHALITAHEPDGCNCRGLIEEMVKSVHNIINTQRQYYEFTKTLRDIFSKHTFVCNGLQQCLLSLIPHVEDFGDDYSNRWHSIESMGDQGLVAFEYWDAVEDKPLMMVYCQSPEFPGYPVYELIWAVLEHGVTHEAMEAISNPEARDFLGSLL